MGCRDFCADVDVATAVGLPAHVETSGCRLNRFAPYCRFDSGKDGYIVSAPSSNATGYVHCTSHQDTAHVVYEAGTVPLLCIRAPVAITASPSDSVLLVRSTEVLAGEAFVYTVQLRVNSSHLAVGISSQTPVAVRTPFTPRSFTVSQVCLFSLIMIMHRVLCNARFSGDVISATVQGRLR
jgi:hypothetical protein